MNWLGKFYQWFWYTFEFWLTPVNRRPLTFIMRDYFFLHPGRAWPMVAAWYAGLTALCFTCPIVSLVLGILSAFVLGHVVWGAPWILHQQEEPQYLGEKWDGKEWVAKGN